jgi:hypothetical protein
MRILFLTGDGGGNTIIKHAREGVRRISCRVAEGYGPDDATTTGPAVIKTGRSVPIPARFAGDMDIRRVVGRFAVAPELTSLIPLNPDEAFCVYGRAGPSAAPEIRP